MKADYRTFDMKTYHHISDEYSDEVEASFATVSRMVRMIGGIPFRQLLQEKWGDSKSGVMSRILETVPAEPSALFRDHGEVRRHLTALREAPDMSFERLIEDGHQKSRQSLYSELMALRRFGIYLPTHGVTGGCDCLTIVAKRALRGLVGPAGGLTYMDLFVTHQDAVSNAAVVAVQRALKSGFLYALSTYQCCAQDGTCCPGGGSCFAPVGEPCIILSSTKCC